ncbi:MAG: hypothetical protein V2A79_12480, partial [Planctomycetota bacterium]
VELSTNPPAVTTMVRPPSGTLARLNAPPESVVVESAVPDTVTVAPATDAPVMALTTWPVTVPDPPVGPQPPPAVDHVASPGASP